MYIDDYKLLREKVNYTDDYIELDDLVIRNFTFKSKNSHILPGEDSYGCTQHNFFTKENYNFDNDTGLVSEVLDIHDSKIKDNIEFRYHVFSPKGASKTNKVVMLFHGFNEKTWYKYFVWTKSIVQQTGKTVVLFPIAFHMNRAPEAWSNARMMYQASEYRKKLFPNIISSSLSNVAISTRIHAKPQRFVWSGLQTYYDIIDFIEEFKSGNHPFIEADASLDMLTYSIGSFLAQILLITNYKNYFSNSKLCMFCGGATFNRFTPVTKFILDSEANVNLYSFIIEHLESHMKNDSSLRHYMDGDHQEGLSFRNMLSYMHNSEHREKVFSKLSKNILAITLKKDSVIPPYEIINTLQGKYRDIPVDVRVMDFPYDYQHEDPFPAIEKYREQADAAFNSVFNIFGEFLK